MRTEWLTSMLCVHKITDGFENMIADVYRKGVTKILDNVMEVYKFVCYERKSEEKKPEHQKFACDGKEELCQEEVASRSNYDTELKEYPSEDINKYTTENIKETSG